MVVQKYKLPDDYPYPVILLNISAKVKSVENENKSFLNRVFNQKSVISPKKYDKDFNEMVNKFNAKKKANKKLILPPIH